MRLYADTSWWLGYKCRRDVHHSAAISLFDRHTDAEVLWTPWQNVEAFNGFCQAERAGLVAKDESRRMIRGLEQEIRMGYWLPSSLIDGCRAHGGRTQWAEHSLNFVVRAMDLFHVAIAIEIAADALLSFDADQAVSSAPLPACPSWT